MIPFLGAVEYWHWWALGGTLAIVEAFLPGFVFLWLGIAAGLVGCLLWLWPGIGLDYQVLIFAALSVASVVGTDWVGEMSKCGVGVLPNGCCCCCIVDAALWFFKK